MKQRFLLIMMFLLAIAGKMSADEISVSPVSIDAGGTKEFNLNLTLETAQYAALQFDLVLPKGIDMALYEGELDFLPKEGHMTKNSRTGVWSHAFAANKTASDDASTTYTFILYSSSNELLKAYSGALFTINLQADQTANASCTGYVKNFKLAASGGASGASGASTTLDDISFAITVNGGTTVKPTIKVDDKTRKYGEANPEFTCTVTEGTYTGTLQPKTSATESDPVGTYSIDLPTSDDYTFTPGTLTVEPAPLTISGGTYTIKQGDPLPTFAAVYTGFKNNETSSVLTEKPTLTLQNGVTSTSAPGDYTITVTGGAAANYDITRQNGTLTITEADAITVTAKSYEITYGDALPNFSYTVTEGATLNGEPTITCDATADSGAGEYDIVISKGNVSNFGATFVNGKLTIKKAPLTISGGTYSIKQGDPLPTFAAVYTGFKNNETSSVLTEKPTLTLQNGVTSVSAPGDYAITVTGGAAANYDITRENGTLTITEADAITVTAKSYEITYGDALPDFSYTVTEGATLNGEPTITCDATADSGAGEYDIVISKGNVSNFGATFVNGKLTIKKASLTATAKSYTRKEGQPNPTFEIEYSGFVKGQTESVLTTKPTATTTAVETSEPGEYAITVAGGEAANYEFTYVPGTLTVTDADVFTVTAKSYEITYGDDLPQFGYEADNGLEGTPVISCEATLTQTPGAGEYDIVLEKGTISNYKVNLVKGKLTIKKATLTATADNCSKQQGEANPDFTITYSGWKFNDDESALTVAPTATAETDAATAPGTYDITVSGGEAANYDFSYVKGTLTINEADPLTVTAKSYEIFYGDDIPAFEYTSQGATVNGTPEITCEATSNSPVGVYDIVIEKGTVTNYNDTYVNGKLTIKKAMLTVKVKDTSVEQGKATPTFEITYEGFKNGEDKSALTKEPVAVTTRELMSDIGYYDITLSGGEAQNYDFTYVNGQLEVTPPGLVTITVTNCDRYYGEANPTFTYTVSGGELEGEPTLACTATETSGVGDYTITIEKGTVSNLYTKLVPGTMTIKKTSLTVIADDATRDYYDENPTFTCSYSGFVNNETDEVLTTKPSYRTTATSSCDPGEYEITPYGAEADNYEIYYVSGTLTVVKTVRDDEGNLIEYDGENATLTSLGYDPVNDDGGVVVPDGVTQIADDAFDALSDEEKGQVNYVDLSNSTVTGITVDRESGLFEGFPENALIMLPEGNNDGGEPNVVIGNTCRELVIDDDKEIVLPADFTAQKVTYSRTLSAADEAYTMFLPFSQTSDENVKFYELTSSTSDNLVFSEVATTEPNMPYLAVPTVAGASLSIQTSTLVKKNTDADGSEKTVTGYEMRGTQKRINRDDAMGFYILQDGNEWHPIGATSPATVYIPAYRAYIVATTGAAARLFTIFGDEDATTIKSIKTIDADGSEQWYDLNGRKLSGMPAGKGAYIMNGKKVITK